MLDQLKFDILANDMTGQAFASVRRSLGQTEGALANIREQTRRVGRSMRNVGAGLSLGLTAPLVAFGKQAFRAFGEQEKALAAVRQAVEATGGAAGLSADELGRMASELQSVTTFGDEQILGDVTAPLLTFKNIAGDVFGEAQKLALDLSTIYGNDLRSATIQLGKALNDPVKGISALSRVGIQFTEDQKDVIEALVETGDVAGAQALILEELNSQVGGQAAAAAQTAEGAVTQLNNAWGDFREELGAVIAELLPPLVSGLSRVVDWLQALSPETKKFLVVAGGLAAVLGPVVGVLGLIAIGLSAISAPVLAAGAAIAGFAALVAANWQGIKNDIQTVRDAFTAFSEFINQPLSDIVAQSRDFLVDRMGAVWEDMRSALEAVRGFFVSIFGEEIVSAFEQFHVQMFDTAVQLMTGLRETLVGGMEWIREKLGGALDWIGEKWQALGDLLVFQSLVPDMIDAIGAEFARLEPLIMEPTERATRGVSESFKRTADDVANAITGPFQAALTQGDLSFKGFASNLMASADQMADRIINDSFQRITDALSGLLSSGFGSLLGGLSGGVTTAANNPFQGAGLFTAGGGIALPGFQHGGEFTVGGRGGVDQNLVQFMATRGERVTVTPAGEGGRRAPMFGAVSFHFPNVRDQATAREAGGSAKRRLAELARKGGGYL